jgi:hypothetical protein
MIIFLSLARRKCYAFLHTARNSLGRLRLKCDGTRAENRFHLSAKRTSHLNRRGASVQSTTGSRGVRISGSNAGYIIFRGSVKGTGYQLHSPVFPSLPLPFVTCAITFQLDSNTLLWEKNGEVFFPSSREFGGYPI